jgi:hypothetical protein
MKTRKNNFSRLLDSGFWILDSKSSRRGQSLIEAMVAISLLTTGFLGLVALLSRSFFLNRVISDETTANYLAAEGIEIAKNLIDHDVYLQLAGAPGATGWGTCFSVHNDVELDYATTDCNQLAPYNSANPDVLMFNPTTHLYGYGQGGNAAATGFTREIQVSESVPNQITVDSIVRWSTGPVTSQSIRLEDVFYNWHP